MKTIIPKEKPIDSVVNVGVTSKDGLVNVFGTGDRHAWRLSFTPDQAVKLWRVMAAEQYTTLSATDVDGVTVTVSVGLDKAGRVTEDSGDMFTIQDGTGEVLLTLTPDQALALAWTIKRCCEAAIYTDTPGTENAKLVKLPKVWVLSSRRLLTGDAAGDGTELIGGHEEVFTSKDAALGALRDFMKPLVLQAHPEGHFAEDMMTSDVKSLDDTLDEIMDEDGHPDVWLYDGSKQSFEVSLSCHEVKQ